MIHTLEAVGNFRWSVENDTFLYIILCIIIFWHCKLHILSITFHVKVAFKSNNCLWLMPSYFLKTKMSYTTVTFVLLSRYSMFLPVGYVQISIAIMLLKPILKHFIQTDDVNNCVMPSGLLCNVKLRQYDKSAKWLPMSNISNKKWISCPCPYYQLSILVCFIFIFPLK